MPGGISQSQNGESQCDSPYPRSLTWSHAHRKQVEWRLPKAGRAGKGEFLFDGCRVPVLQDEKMAGYHHTPVRVRLAPQRGALGTVWMAHFQFGVFIKYRHLPPHG